MNSIFSLPSLLGDLVNMEMPSFIQTEERAIFVEGLEGTGESRISPLKISTVITYRVSANRFYHPIDTISMGVFVCNAYYLAKTG